MDPVARYLTRHAEPTAGRTGEVVGTYRRAIVIPAMNESPAFVPGLAALGDDVLSIVVVNAPADAPAAVRAANATLAAVAGAAPRTFVIEATLPSGQGVGLARKLGFDLALALWAEGRLRQPWIHTTDADARVPAATLHADPDAPAMSLPFVHVPTGDDPIVDEATAIYDRSLRYWVAGLRFAGSRWAHMSLGSALAVRADAYAVVGGMPRRQAGEDFYLLAKLGKLAVGHGGQRAAGQGGQLAAIAQPDLAPIEIRARRSDRVPFGTGPAVGRIADQLQAGDVPTFYDPRVFTALRDILRAVDDDRRPEDPAWAAVEGDAKIAAATRSARDETQRRRRIAEWLDAFVTLKLVHALQADDRPPRPWTEALAAAPFEVPVGISRPPRL